MVSVNKIGGSDVTQSVELYGKSTDAKPLDIPNGSSFYEMDTYKVYLFDEEGKAWIEQK